jgi:hypothetical protein
MSLRLRATYRRHRVAHGPTDAPCPWPGRGDPSDSGREQARSKGAAHRAREGWEPRRGRARSGRRRTPYLWGSIPSALALPKEGQEGSLKLRQIARPQPTPKLVPLKFGRPWCENCTTQLAPGELVGWWMSLFASARADDRHGQGRRLVVVNLPRIDKPLSASELRDRALAAMNGESSSLSRADRVRRLRVLEALRKARA